ncbi:uncharacterized protein MYCFIDRAFT_177082 [Pseudocercospora fijiensis CIRAD86]|uniref:Uncharacterized protein n=1 Tax=Pseudocercospora fijiensis (strain CIRAD86) TaxID=383855 RepID=M2ZM09_PSEFD|nr:uncharacterized protein MYCFIDRAFT_177082 [Pseudocercospora fijiensis CIRAD86]EME80104.1 hypothetical protein MYCFIDRAFT_177082 [Pseudocercospora fijiensis CIRAD86]
MPSPLDHATSRRKVPPLLTPSSTAPPAATSAHAAAIETLSPIAAGLPTARVRVRTHVQRRILLTLAPAARPVHRLRSPHQLFIEIQGPAYYLPSSNLPSIFQPTRPSFLYHTTKAFVKGLQPEVLNVLSLSQKQLS